MILSLLLFEATFLRIVSITFTSLILTELIMVQLEVHSLFNPFIIISNIISLLIYFASVFLLPNYFGFFYYLF
jgi:phospholipid-translocating ATPase